MSEQGTSDRETIAYLRSTLGALTVDLGIMRRSTDIEDTHKRSTDALATVARVLKETSVGGVIKDKPVVSGLCKRCGGSGGIACMRRGQITRKTCPKCRGTGKVALLEYFTRSTEPPKAYSPQTANDLST